MLNSPKFKCFLLITSCITIVVARAHQEEAATVATTASSKTVTTTSDNKRISQQKCDEYGKLTYTTFVNTLLLGGKPAVLKASKCNVTTALIVGGTKTRNGELPHMAAIGWNKPPNISFRCGGSLISETFVLTAAHCFGPDGDYPNIVRLGDQNLYSKDDGLQELDVPIKYFI